MMLQTTEYYEEFLRYYKLAERQQKLCNLGTVPYEASGVNDSLMENVHLYDVVERKYAGFSQIVNDIFYGWDESHPYWTKMVSGQSHTYRETVAQNWTDHKHKLDLSDWLYLFILHRVTGSAINYATKPSGYHNTLLFNLHKAECISEMMDIIKNHPKPFYTSGGYQFPSFPKPPDGYKRGGDYYLCEYAPRLACDLARFLCTGSRKKDLRTIGDWMLDWNTANGLKRYAFQYAAVVADIADWLPDYVERDSLFYYGTNARECISYLAKRPSGVKHDDYLDQVMLQIYKDTGSVPYNAEDVCCDFIRWSNNFIKPGADYGHLDCDKIWNSSKIIHPYGRQKAMLDLGLIDSFNTCKLTTTRDQVIKNAGLTEIQYLKMVKQLPEYSDWTCVPSIFS